ncbi:hypothetical protein O181_025920 [Austropuccinia psidii MF-1]|uniref:Uncharacterized protein n=1 Tax=Austropuccinia psidii MF-1 TaxID=1389203 RepID=A0A9Q3H1N8_9BASI|nr:hypothetical protein [Austropuccinia psidii MF-1]
MATVVSLCTSRREAPTFYRKKLPCQYDGYYLCLPLGEAFALLIGSSGMAECGADNRITHRLDFGRQSPRRHSLKPARR